MSTRGLLEKELKLAMEELDRLIGQFPQIGYYKTLRGGLQMIASEIEKKWPPDSETVKQLRGMSAYVARQLDYPEPGDTEYKLWTHIAAIQDYATGTN